MKFNINIKEPYKTAIILGVTISVVVGGAYLAMPEGWRQSIKDYISKKFGKKDETIKTE